MHYPHSKVILHLAHLTAKPSATAHADTLMGRGALPGLRNHGPFKGERTMVTEYLESGCSQETPSTVEGLGAGEESRSRQKAGRTRTV